MILIILLVSANCARHKAHRNQYFWCFVIANRCREPNHYIKYDDCCFTFTKIFLVQSSFW